MSRTKAEALGLYAKGWTDGNLNEILEAAAPGFRFGDPDREVSRDEFPAYYQGFTAAQGATVRLTGVVSYEVGNKLMACCDWEAGDVRGTGLITVGDEGVEREVVAIV